MLHFTAASFPAREQVWTNVSSGKIKIIISVLLDSHPSHLHGTCFPWTFVESAAQGSVAEILPPSGPTVMDHMSHRIIHFRQKMSFLLTSDFFLRCSIKVEGRNPPSCQHSRVLPHVVFLKSAVIPRRHRAAAGVRPAPLSRCFLGQAAPLASVQK